MSPINGELMIMEGNDGRKCSSSCFERANKFVRAMLINVTIHLTYDNGKEISKNLTI